MKNEIPLFNASTAEAVPEVPKDTRSVGVVVITDALVQIEMLLKKIDEATVTVQGQLQKLENQKIGLSANKAMCIDLKKVIEQKEAAAIEAAQDRVTE